MSKQDLALYFELFNEIGIIEQLSRTSLETLLPHGFLQSHFSVLNHLIRVRDGGTPLQIANAFQVPKTTMTHTLAILEKHNLVVMRANPKDGRSKCVWITDEGRAFRDESIAKLSNNLVPLSKQIDADKIEKILPILKELRVYLDENRDN
ncbi:MAG: MarR family transcriptional regulator [Aliivibrio sp.]|uniref:MarR family winged helix-turn-helix transcriptional regulator n=1 Tax=Aliivibrio sp. TaxID=1872443 RepID=UPI001A50AF03|nr:MarR family transcriptional regulator [Aliivibrio sp.]